MIFVKAINEEVSFLKKKEAVFIGALLVISVVLCIFVYEYFLWKVAAAGG